jgi:basic amino acid/polyamine antiporter, APA family
LRDSSTRVGSTSVGQSMKGRGLFRVLGLTFGVAATLGGVVGQGILRAPGIVASGVPSAAAFIVVWITMGVLCLISAMAAAELGASLPRAGGTYVYGHRAFGEIGGLVTGWADGWSVTVSISFFGVVVAECLQRLGLLTMLSTGAVAAGFIVLATVFNLQGPRGTGRWQIVFSALKGAVLVAFALALMIGTDSAEGGEATPASPAVLTWSGIAFAARAAFGAYSGWTAPLYFLEETREPRRNIVRSLLGGIALITIVYALFNIALLHALPIESIAQSTLPAADAARRLVGEAGDWSVTLFALFSVGAITSIGIMAEARMLFAMSRDGLAPRVLQLIARNGSPVIAVGAIGLCAAVFALTGAYEPLLAVYAPLALASDVMLCAAAIRLRIAEPALERPYRMPLFPVPAVLGLTIDILLMTAFVLEDPENSLWSVLLLIAVLPIYWIRRTLARLPH